MPTTIPFNNLITFSRGSNATVTGSNGLIQWAPNNLLTFSEQFDNAAWSKNNGTVAANVTAAPDGTLTADKFVENTSNSSHFIIQSATTIATSYTFSVYAKAAGRTFVLVYHDQSNSGAVFNLTNGAITTPSGIPLAAASVTDAGNGWYRCAITVTATAASNGFRAQLGDSATNYVYTGDGTSGIFLWGAQLELGSTATTYNPTTVKNLLGFSEAFDNAGWQKLGSSIVTGAQANPVNGLFNAQKLMEDTSTGIHRTFQTVTIAAGPHTLSFYAKSAGRDWIYINASGALYTAFVNVATGAVGATVGSPTVTMTPIGSGWYRVAMTYQNATAGASNQQIWLASNSTTTSYTGDGNSGVYIYGAQLSDSASLDPYVPTPGAAPSSTAFYGPRFDFDPVTLQPRGLLVEEQRTNLIWYSNAFTTSPWGLDTNADLIANSTASPDGAINAWKMAAKNGLVSNGSSQFFIKAASAITYNTSIFSKAAGYDWLQIAVFDGTNGNRYWFNVRTGAIGTTAVIGTGFTGVSASITPAPNGFFRCSLIATSSTATSYSIYIYPSAANGSNGTGNANGDGVFVYGAQIEAGAFATSYIPTVASTVTRSADVATISGSLFSQWYRGAEGTYFFEGNSLQSPGVLQTFYQDGNITHATNGVGNLTVYNGNTYSGVSTPVTVGAANFKSGVAYTAGASASAISVNAGAATTFTNPGLAPQTAFAIGNPVTGGGSGARNINGYIRQLGFIPARAADFQLQGLTT